MEVWWDFLIKTQKMLERSVSKLRHAYSAIVKQSFQISNYRNMLTLCLVGTISESRPFVGAISESRPTQVR